MVSIALMGAGCGLAGAAALLYFSGYLSSPTHSRGDLALAAVIGIYPMTFLSVFFNVALAGAAAAGFDGRPIGVQEALGISWKRLGRIAQWSLLAAGVGSSWSRSLRGFPVPDASRPGCSGPPGAWRRSSPCRCWRSRALVPSKPPRSQCTWSRANGERGLPAWPASVSGPSSALIPVGILFGVRKCQRRARYGWFRRRRPRRTVPPPPRLTRPPGSHAGSRGASEI
jgi:hypothetical protein